jgi:serine protease
MKKLLSSLFICLTINSIFSQNVYKDYVDGEIYVKFNPWALKQVSRENPNNIPLEKLSDVNKILSKYGVSRAYKPFFQASDDARLPYILKFEFSQKNNVNAFVNEISKVYGVEYAEKVPAVNSFTTPNDPSYGLQTQLPQINAPNAWNVYNNNSNITVAIVDNAVAWTHSDLVGNTYTNAIEAAGIAGVDDDNNGYIDDFNGWDVADNDNNAVPTNTLMDHGTHCAGIAGARNNNGNGIGSIGWNIKIIPVKCTTDGGAVATIGNGFGGIIYAAKAGARVISCSWGGAAFAAAEQTVIDYAWGKGCILIIAAGNANTNVPSYPGAYNNVYCVSSCGATNVKSGFSNYGQPGNAWVDICAPGENIYSTLPNGGAGTYGYLSGTSMATPLVAGLAGLMLSKCPFMTQQNVLNCISSTAVNIYTIGANSTYSPGLQLGAGRIEAFAAMNCAAAYLLVPPVANFFTLTRNTCPNTPIVFQDSSLYAPTGWSWSFQGGTPATSTLSAPTVQWALPGTYSVALTVTNANGNNAVTKVSYITIAGPIALPLTEGFQTLPFLPNNWTPYNVGNDAFYYTRYTGTGGFGTSTACATYDNYDLDASGTRDEMRTPKYSFANVVSAHLRFDVAYKEFDNVYSDSLQVKLTTNCGTSWTSMYFKGGSALSTSPGTLQANLFVPLAAEWRRDSIDITALSAGQANVMASFINHGHYGQAMYLDNINLFFPAPTTNFIVPPPVCPSVAVTFTNTSSGAATYTWNFQGGSPATSTLTNPTITYTAGGVYTASLTAQNGTTTILLTKTLSINSTPVIAVNNQTICAGGQATVTASGAGTYSWSNGFNGNPLLVNPAINTVYTVTGTLLGCVNTNTVSVTIGSQLAIFIAPSQPTVCSAGASTLSASGAVNYTWSTGANSIAIVVTPTANSTYSIIGTNGACTGTSVITITVVPTPSMNISASPSASICLGQTATLTASGAYSAYTWVTPTVNAASMTVSPAANTTYTVYATAAGGCATNSVFAVVIKPLPVAAVTMTNATCGACPDGQAQVVASGPAGPFTYQWLPVGGTGSFVSGFTQGCYSVNVNGANGCTVQNTICVGADSISTGVKAFQQKFASLLIYPNPAHDHLFIEYQGTFNYSLYNNLGQLIIERNSNQNMAFVQTNDLSKGVYTIVVEQGNEKIRKKLIIN